MPDRDDQIAKQEIDIVALSTDMQWIKKDISEIKSNHLHHIYERLGKIETKMAYYAGGITFLLSIVELVKAFK